MVHKNFWVLTLVCAILGALPLASCESDTPPAPTGDEFPLCEGNKSDDPSCPVALPGEDAVSYTDTIEGSQPADTEQPAPPPDCSKVTEPFPTGTWVMCDNTWNKCQIEWHYVDPWGCLASCWEIPNSPPPALEDYAPESLVFSNCQPSL